MAIDAALVGTKTSHASSLTTGAGTTTASDSTFVIALSWDRDSSVSAVSDSKGNTYTLAGTIESTSGHKKALYYSANATGGASHTATATFSGSEVHGTIYLIEITGAAADSFDQVATNNADAVSPYTVDLPALSQADEVIITIHGSHAAGNPVTYSSSNTTILDQESNGSLYWTSAVSKHVVSSTDAFSPSFTGGSTGTATIAASFKAATSGSTEGTATPTTGSVALQGRAPLVNDFSTITLRGTMINEAGSPLADLTGITCLVWYGSAPVGAPDESLSSLTTNANGSYSFALALGSLAFDDPVYRVIYLGDPPTRNQAGRRVPDYE